MPVTNQICEPIFTEEWESVCRSEGVQFKEGAVRELSWRSTGHLCIIFKDDTRVSVPVALKDYQRIYHLLLTACAQNRHIRIGFTGDTSMDAICLQVLGTL
jgi:hypothetical protein